MDLLWCLALLIEANTTASFLERLLQGFFGQCPTHLTNAANKSAATRFLKYGDAR
ncbi:hypothetical protein OROHE_009725 [Orobanche hederae]